MRLHRTAHALAAATATLGLAVLTTSPASAAEGPSKWQPWVAYPNVTCSSTTAHPLTTRVSFQTCIIRGTGGALQPVLVVKNDAPHAIQIRGYVYSDFSGTTADCPTTYLSSGQRTTCLGYTGTGTSGTDSAWSDLGIMNGGAWNWGQTLEASA
ncbi:hypothetical protein [Streptomyces katrae]|uniref:hypothetical protein n=1 Tax=Streptomyces katrae TaxID=68223 RepID=UPI0004BF1A6A|nr:hypothetical protein [Streptomyces katrae]